MSQRSGFKSYRTDTKVNYGRPNNLDPADKNNLLPQFMTHLHEAEKYAFGQDYRNTRVKTVPYGSTSRSYYEDLRGMGFSGKSVFLLVLIFVLTIIMIFYEFNL